VSRAPVITHWSLPPQHAGYWPRLGGGTDWPEHGGMGPMAGPHIPGLIPGWHETGLRPQRTGPAIRPPRGGMTGQRARSSRRPRRGLFNAFRPAAASGAPRWR
jgi:hypothetical protein